MAALEFHCQHVYTTRPREPAREPAHDDSAVLDPRRPFTLDASFTADAGVTALVGPSGGGKSTILHLIAGILRPSRGTIALNGRPLVDVARHIFVPPEQRGVGVVFQDHLLFPHLSVEQNLRYGQRRRPARPVDFARVVYALELSPLLARQPHTLSGGQRQRVALGRALLRGPELLLLDEPLTALDASLKQRIIDDLQRVLAEWHVPTLLVSHDARDVERLADRVIHVEAGRVKNLATGTP